MTRMPVFRYFLLIWLIGVGPGFAQSVYQGPSPEALFTAASEKAFLTEFTTKFKSDFDATGQYARLNATGLDAWEMSLFDARKNQYAFYKAYPKADQFSAAFKQYVDACIRWNYWHLLLAYPIMRGNAQTRQGSIIALPSVMTDELATLNANDEAALPAEPYRDFLLFYVTYFNAKARNFVKYSPNDIQTSLPDKATFAKQHLSGHPYQYVLARILVENCERVPPSSVRTVVNMLSSTPNSTGYVNAVKAQCGAVLAKKDDPVPATKTKPIDPNAFSFTNQNGEDVALEAFKGKVVYVDLWASWCGPCRAEFPFSKLLQDRLTKKQKEKVVFLYLSIDDNDAVWKRALTTLQLEGEQGLSKGGWKSRAAQYFDVQSIPRYLLIGKDGQIADANAKRPSMTDAILQDILKLVSE